MSIYPCAPITAQATAAFADEEARAELRALAAEEASARTFVEFLASRCGPELAPLVRQEFREMPAGMVEMIIGSWLEADGAGKGFELRSEPPVRPLEFARHQRVRLTLEYERDRAVVSISHVPGRHAEWYQPVAADLVA